MGHYSFWMFCFCTKLSAPFCAKLKLHGLNSGEETADQQQVAHLKTKADHLWMFLHCKNCSTTTEVTPVVYFSCFYHGKLSISPSLCVKNVCDE